eukprot:scpid27181/ scgid4437/ Lysosomal alpha-mannosidase; Alpha-D-mannoside mannohydrolase; Alpha-mannosidase A; Alpha-mannosidase 60 kDa subunit; Alpha-mannosidase 58 kDa subunit
MAKYMVVEAAAVCVFLVVALLTIDVSQAQEPASNGSHINIWIVTHTHDDVGWLQTVDQYYISEVQWILDTAMRCLMDNPNRRFTYVEIAYFYRWWNEQSPDMQQAVVKLAKSGQLEFNLAGWCMNDEAATSFFSVINQMSEGALFLHDALGPDIFPKVGWHVDPFGHSSVTPSLWADMGFDAFGINRIDFRDKDRRKANRELEFIWRGSKSLGEETEIFTHIMDSHYCTPGECGYDGNLQIQNDPLLPTYPLNAGSQAVAFVNMARARNQWYRHNHILIPFGCDFGHQNAFKSFDQMDKLIDAVNGNPALNATVRYGTFGSYVAAINALNLTWPVYTGDFFPYASNYGQYWTGYYTSRPLLKGYVRSRAALMRSVELLLYAAAKSPIASPLDEKSIMDELGLLRRAMGVTQHHDGVSGTEKQAVADDYYLQLYKGTVACENLASNLLSSMIKGKAASAPQLFQNSSEVMVNLSASDEISVVVFNSLAWERDVVVTVPTNLSNLVVTDSTGKQVTAQQVLPSPSYDPEVANKTAFELLFITHLPAFGFETFFLKRSSLVEVSEFVEMANEDIAIENAQIKATFSGATHRLSSVALKDGGKTITVDNNLVQYASAAGNNEPASGAYVFRPMQDNYVSVGQQKNGAEHSTGWHFPVKQNKYGSHDFPLLLATPTCQPGQTFPDTFAVSIQRSDVFQTSFHMFRADGAQGWSQNPWVNYAILDDSQPPLNGLSGYQFGTSEVKASTSKCAQAEITFDKAFTAAPQVITTIEDPQIGVSFYASSVLVTSTTSATVNVCRADGAGGGWGKSVFLNYLAFDSSAKATHDDVRFGSFGVSGSFKGPKQTNVSFSSMYPVYRGIVLATAVSKSGQVYAVTSYNSSVDGFGMNVHSLDGKPWTDDLTVNWLIFRRNTIEAPVMDDESIVTTITTGPVVQEVRQVFKNHYAITSRLYQGSSPTFQFLDQTYDIGPLDLGKELVTRFQTSLSNPTWYSDDTGLELIPRQYDPTKDEAVAGNYYPMVMGSFMNDTADAVSMSFLSERSHGSASLGDGMMEVMLHRRCLQDDHFGVGEVLNETDHIRPRLWVVPADSAETGYNLRRKLQYELQNPPFVMYGKAAAGAWAQSYTTSFSAMSKPLPDNVHLLALKARNDSETGKIAQYVIRLQHVFEKDEGSPLAVPVTLNTDDYFAEGFQPTMASESTLSANRDRSAVNRLPWKAESGDWPTSSSSSS